MQRLFWSLGLSIAVSLIARFGLYDYQDKLWHGLMLWAPLIVVAVLAANYRDNRTTITETYFSWGLIAALFAQTALLAGGILWAVPYLTRGRDLTLNVCNAAPYGLAIAVSYQANRLESRTEGYWQVGPGGCKEIKRNVLRVLPAFSVFAASKSNLDEWLESRETRWNPDKYETLKWSLGGKPLAEIDGSIAFRGSISGQIDRPKAMCINPSVPVANDSPQERSSILRQAGACSGEGHEAQFYSIPYDFSGNDKDQYDVSYARGGRDAAFQFCNLVPYTTRLFLHYRAKPLEWLTESPVDMQPGECRSMERNFQRVDPKFYFQAVSDGEIARWHLSSYDKNVTEIRADGNDATACGPDQYGVAMRREQGALMRCGQGETVRGFIEVSGPFEGGRETRILSIPLVRLPLLDDDVTVDLGRAQTVVRELAALLPERMKHLANWAENVEIPYRLGIAVGETTTSRDEEKYWEQIPGVRVRQALTRTPLGIDVPFNPGDVITEFDGQTIFSPDDLRMGVIRFAHSFDEGIMKQYVARGWRGNQAMEWKGYYYFNEAFWPRTDADQKAAEDWGWSSGLSLLGDAVKRRCSGDANPSICQWEKTQELWRLKQMYGAAYDRENWKASLTQGVVTFVALGWIGRAARFLLGVEEATAATVTELALSTALGAAEAATMAANEAPLGADVQAQVKKAAKMGAGIGFATAIIAPLTPVGKLTH